MMDLYTEKMKNNYYKKINVNFKSQRDFLYSGWEINQITNSLNNVYYKNELINTIKSLLSSGTNLEDIYVLKSSVKVGKSYDSLKEGYMNLKKSQDIAELYSMGSPIPLIPNADTLKVYYIFELLREFYGKCSSLKLKTLEKRYTLHNLFEDRDHITNTTDLKEYLKDEVYNCNFSIETEELDKKIRKLFSLLEVSLKAFSNLFKDLELLNQFNEEYSLDIEEGLKVQEYTSLKKYFTFFERTFNRLERPFICVYEREAQQLNILCTDLISIKNFTEDNYRFFETKNISQNSPLTIAICVGLGFVPSLFKVGESLLSARKTILGAEKEVLKFKEKSSEIESHIAKQYEELRVIEKEIEDMKKAMVEVESNIMKNEAKEDASKTSVKTVENNSFINDVIDSLEKKNNNHFKKTLQEKDLSIENVTVRENEAS